MAASRRFHILVVDDNPDLLASVRFALEAFGTYEVETATNGMEGLERAVARQPDCMVIDVKMPSIDGNQLIRVLRGDPATAQIPLIILSALVQEDDLLRGHLAGVDQYLTKPFDVEALVEAIDHAVQLTPEARQARLRALLEQTERAER